MSTEPAPIRIGIAGITGRMGSETAAAAQADDRVILVGGISRTSDPAGLAALLTQIDCLIDLTLPAATATIANAAAGAGVPLLCGVTGLTETGIISLRQAGDVIPVRWSRNLSRGIPLVADLLRQLAAALGDFDVEIIEAHHRRKRDAPSGTAEILAEAIIAARGEELVQPVAFGRHGASPRQPNEIGMHSLRAGGLAGEHTVLFANDDEELRLSHRALSRRAFARGAIEAAIDLASRENGLYIV